MRYFLLQFDCTSWQSVKRNVDDSEELPNLHPAPIISEKTSLMRFCKGTIRLCPSDSVKRRCAGLGKCSSLGWFDTSNSTSFFHFTTPVPRADETHQSMIENSESWKLWRLPGDASVVGIFAVDTHLQSFPHRLTSSSPEHVSLPTIAVSRHISISEAKN